MAVIPFFTTFFFMEILQGVQSRLSELDCDLLLFGVNHPDQLEASLRHHVLRSRVDGVLLFSMVMPDSLVKHFLHHRTPIVLVDTHDDRCDSLAVDNQKGSYVATNHLITLGHKRIGMLTANLESVPSRERVLGFRKAMDEAGLAIPRTFIKSSHSTKLDGFTRESGYEVMQQFIAMGRQMPTAFIVSSDIQASGALNALAEAGLNCPEDISVVGFDDIDLASHIGLTTMRQPMFEMGELATDLLMERLAHSQREPTHSLFVPKLVVRKTSKALQHAACAVNDNAA